MDRNGIDNTLVTEDNDSEEDGDEDDGPMDCKHCNINGLNLGSPLTILSFGYSISGMTTWRILCGGHPNEQ